MLTVSKSIALSVINRPDEIPAVFTYALETGGGRTGAKSSHDEQLKIARKMREALVKTAPIAGLPKVDRLQMNMELSLTSSGLGYQLLVLAQNCHTHSSTRRAISRSFRSSSYPLRNVSGVPTLETCLVIQRLPESGHADTKSYHIGNFRAPNS